MVYYNNQKLLGVFCWIVKDDKNYYGLKKILLKQELGI